MAKLFGSSLGGILLNPIGYIGQRESVDKASDNYYFANPINLSNVQSIEQLAVVRSQWVDACTTKLKSDDIGKNKTKSAQSCEAKFNASPEVQEVMERLNIAQAQSETEAKAFTQKIIIGIFLIVVLFLIVWLLTS